MFGHTRRTLVVQSTLGTRLNPALYSEYLRKEHERYQRRKEYGSIKLVHDMTNREKRHARKSWRQRKQRQKEKQTSLNRHLNDTPPPTPNTFVSDEYNTRSGRKRAACYREVDKLKIKLQSNRARLIGIGSN